MLFGSSGIRQRFDRALVETALSVGAIIGERFPDCIVGIDTRTTSPLLARAIISGITGAGGDARFTGIVPTPSVAYNARTVKAGCMITASHNPEEYNGIKLFNPDGSSFTLAQQKSVEENLNKPHWTTWQHQGVESSFDALSPHKKAILDAVSIEPKLSVVIDCGNGAGSLMTPGLMADAEVKTICLNCNPAGKFARPSEPLKEYLGYVGEIIKETGADCAVVHDGDADRMVGFDNRGRYIDGDHLLLLFAEHLGAKKVVTTSDASMIIEEVADVHRTPVGGSASYRRNFFHGEISEVSPVAPGSSPITPYARMVLLQRPSSARLRRAAISRNGSTLCHLIPSSENLCRMSGHAKLLRVLVLKIQQTGYGLHRKMVGIS